MSNGFTTVPINIISGQPASLTYFNTTTYPIPGNIYVLKNTSNIDVSDTFSKNSESINYSTNASPGNFDASNSYIINDGANNLYSTFKTDPSGASFGFIQFTNTDGSSYPFFQFSSTVPTIATSNYPTGIAYDLSNGFICMTSSANNSVYKITDASNPLGNYSLVSDLSSNIGLSGINSLAFDLSYNLYVSSINPPYYVAKINTDASASVLTSFSGPSYGLAADSSNNLYVGLQGGNIAKFDLSNNTVTNPFIQLSLSGDSGNVLAIYYNSFTNTLFFNTSNLNIYSFNLYSITSQPNLISSNSGISCGFVPDNADSRIFYGANNTNIRELSLPEEYYFSNMVLNNTGNNTLTVFNSTKSISVGTINVFVYDSTTVFYRSTINGNLTDLSELFNLYSTGDKAIETGYKVGIKDLNDIFEKKTSSSFAPVTGYSVGSSDLNQLFNPIPAYVITSKSSNMLTTEFTSLSYNVIIFENTSGPQFPNSPLVSSATCLVNINLNVSLNIVVIGGGGGGSAGNSSCAGGGAGGGAVIYYQNLSVSKNSILTITVGVNGGGRQASNPGKGNSGGAGGNTSSVNITLNGLQTAYLEANGGGAGLGVGTASGYGGGPSGSATNTLGNTGGGGGGTGGGASESPPGAASIAYGNGTNQSPGKLNGILSTSGGQGSNGSSSVGGTGGNSFISSISLPWATGNYIYAGNGGGGGGSGSGGAAGNTTGGAGGGSSAGGGSGSTNGGNAQFYNTTQGTSIFPDYNKNYYYGSGGGGGSQTTQNWGGSGSKAVVMIWYS